MCVCVSVRRERDVVSVLFTVTVGLLPRVCLLFVAQYLQDGRVYHFVSGAGSKNGRLRADSNLVHGTTDG